MSYAEERIKKLCDTAITNAQNIKVAVDKLQALQFTGHFESFDIIGNLQNKPRLECAIWPMGRIRLIRHCQLFSWFFSQ